MHGSFEFPVSARMVAKDQGPARENNVSHCVTNNQPLPGATTVSADPGQEDRFGV